MTGFRKDQMTIAQWLKANPKKQIEDTTLVWIAVLVITVAGFFYINPHYVDSVLIWMWMPRTQLVAILALVLGGGLYWYSRKRKK